MSIFWESSTNFFSSSSWMERWGTIHASRSWNATCMITSGNREILLCGPDLLWKRSCRFTFTPHSRSIRWLPLHIFEIWNNPHVHTLQNISLFQVSPDTFYCSTNTDTNFEQYFCIPRMGQVVSLRQENIQCTGFKIHSWFCIFYDRWQFFHWFFLASITGTAMVV